MKVVFETNSSIDRSRHPPYQYDEKFTGCRWIYSDKYRNIRDWLQPGWFMFVQAMITLSMIFSVIGLLILSIPIMHYAQRYTVPLVGGAAVLEFLSGSLTCRFLSVFMICLFTPALFGFIGWLVFAIQHDTRSWLMYPNFNHLDWAFYIAVLSTVLNLVTSIMLAYETRDAQAKRQKFTNLVYNMHPRFI